MDIDEALRPKLEGTAQVDLQQLFEMIDVDGSGAIEAEEFIAPLSRWVHDSKTAPSSPASTAESCFLRIYQVQHDAMLAVAGGQLRLKTYETCRAACTCLHRVAGDHPENGLPLHCSA